MNIKRILTFAIVAPSVLYLTFVGTLYLNQTSMIYPGARNRVQPVAPHAEGSELLEISTPKADVEAIFLPATDGLAVQQPVMIFAHGNGEVIDYWLTELHGFRERGIGVLLVEYPGFGRSTGEPSEKSIRAT